MPTSNKYQQKAMMQEKKTRSLFFRARLDTLLSERGISQRELAAATGLTPQSVSNYVRGTRSLPAAEELYALAKYFGVTMESFLGTTDEQTGEDQKKPKPPPKRLHAAAKQLERMAAELKAQADELRRLSD